MTNGRGQKSTIRENIFKKYGRYQVHPRPKKDPPADDPDKLKQELLEQIAPELTDLSLWDKKER